MRSLLLLVLMWLSQAALAVETTEGECCENSAKLGKFVQDNQINHDGDYWLAQVNAFGETEKIALIFGLWNSELFCKEIAEAQQRKHGNTYVCYRAQESEK